MRVDLHLHSTASDGSLTPDALVRTAAAGGLDVIALTDHDTVAGITEAADAAAGLIHVIPGIEISTNHATGELHILGYYIDRACESIRHHETTAIARRHDRMVDIIEALRPAGIDVSIAEVVEAAGSARIIARPHLARVLVQRGYASNVSDAFDRWIGNASTAFRPVNLASPELAIQIIHAAGGIAVWAHPDITQFRADARRLAHEGLDGVECFRPRCPPDESLELERVTLDLGLLPTGGSDWHGPWSGRLGSFSLGREEIGAFLERGDIQSVALHVEELSRGISVLRHGTLYPMLHRLEREGLIGDARMGRRGQRQRKVYALGPKRTERLVEWSVRIGR